MRALIYSNWYVSLLIAALIGSYGILFQEVPNLLLAAAVIAATGVVYPMHRVLGASLFSEEIMSVRQRYVLHHRKPLIVISSISAGASLLLFWLSGAQLAPLVFPAILVTLAYVVPCVPTGKGLVRLRDLPLLKVFLIGLVVTLLVAYVFDKSLNEYPLIWAELLVFILAITIPFDIRDMDIDRRNGVLTLPGLIGWRNARYTAGGLMVVATFLCWLLPWNVGYPKIGLTLANCITLLFISRSSPDKSEVYYALGVEGALIFRFIAVFIFGGGINT